MNSFEKGKIIATLRKEAGYTQKSLAEALFITDKAVSKWERGLCLPDSSLLTKLSMLLDADIEYLISGEMPYGRHKWVGELHVEKLDGMIAGKPLLHYMLSYFMLVGITDIAVISNDYDCLRDIQPEKYGLNISHSPFEAEKTMLIYDKFFLFGVNITRQLQHCMSMDKDMRLELHGVEIPIFFKHGHLCGDLKNAAERAEIKNLGRGTIYIPLNTAEEVNDASDFVELYEKYHNVNIADLNEIARLRGLI